jgi:hypothetical protein
VPDVFPLTHLPMCEELRKQAAPTSTENALPE